MWENIPCKTTVVIALDLPDSDVVSNHKTNILCFAPGAAIMRVIYLAVAFGLIGVLVAKATKDQNNKFDDVWRERMEETKPSDQAICNFQSIATYTKFDVSEKCMDRSLFPNVNHLGLQVFCTFKKYICR